jgi:hypothetical protein
MTVRAFESFVPKRARGFFERAVKRTATVYR